MSSTDVYVAKLVNSSDSKTESSTRRIRALDGIRGAAMVLVLIWHYASCQARTTPGSSLAYTMKLLSFSWAGVDLFFVLSGYLIGGILLDQKTSANYFFPFYVRRACRIFPLYYVVYAAFVTGCSYPAWKIGGGGYEWLFDNPLPAWSYPLHLQNFVMAQTGSHGPNWMGVSWSLAVEEQFYLILPLIIRYFPIAAVGWLSAILVVSGPAIRSSLLMCHPNGEIASYVLLPARWDAMFLGVLGAIAIRCPEMLASLRRNLAAIRVITATSFVVLTGLCLVGQGIGSWGMCLLGHSLLAVISLGLILLSTLNASGWVTRFFTNSALAWVGTISYGVYLFHQPVAGLSHGYLLRQSPQIGSLTDAGVTLLSVIVTFLLAVISSRFFETPLVTVGHRSSYRKTNMPLDHQPVATDAGLQDRILESTQSQNTDH